MFFISKLSGSFRRAAAFVSFPAQNGLILADKCAMHGRFSSNLRNIIRSYGLSCHRASTHETTPIFVSDKRYDKVRNQNFGPVLMSESQVNEGNVQKSSFEYEKRADLVFDEIPYYKLPVVHINARWNNTIINISGVDPRKGYCYVSCRTCGFFNAKKKTDHAGEVTGQTAARKAIEKGCTKHVRVVLNGIGPGRNPSLDGLETGGLKIVSITDRTPLTMDGLPQRPRAIRRV